MYESSLLAVKMFCFIHDVKLFKFGKNKRGQSVWLRDMLIEHQGQYRVDGYPGCKQTHYMDVRSAVLLRTQ